MVTKEIAENTMLNKAIMIATTAHGEIHQVRKGTGIPYIVHSLSIMCAVTKYGVDYMIVAVLHDTCEDCDITLDMLRDVFPPHIVEAVDAMTHRKGKESRLQYLDRVKANPIALVVKKADIKHNASDYRGINDETVARWKIKFQDGFDYLNQIDYDKILKPKPIEKDKIDGKI